MCFPKRKNYRKCFYQSFHGKLTDSLLFTLGPKWIRKFWTVLFNDDVIKKYRLNYSEKVNNNYYSYSDD